MGESGGEGGEPLAGWEPRRRVALEAVWKKLEGAAGGKPLSDELIEERHRKVAAEDAWFAE